MLPEPNLREGHDYEKHVLLLYLCIWVNVLSRQCDTTKADTPIIYWTRLNYSRLFNL